LDADNIRDLEARHAAKPEAREAHAALAKAMTDLVHGPGATEEARKASAVLFGGGIDGIGEATFDEIAREIPSKHIDRSALEGAGAALTDVMVQGGLCASKGQARKDAEGGGVYLNNERQTDGHRAVTKADLLFGKYLLLRKGKRNYSLLILRGAS
jgi:tyrosyl-tRNA synthetase